MTQTLLTEAERVPDPTARASAEILVGAWADEHHSDIGGGQIFASRAILHLSVHKWVCRPGSLWCERDPLALLGPLCVLCVL